LEILINYKNYGLVNFNLSLKYEPSVALLRIIASLFIVIFHTGRNNYTGNLERLSAITYLTQHGDIGVNIFFILTGYLVFKNFKFQDPLNFLISRAIRIFPLMWLVVTSMYILSLVDFANISEISFLDYVNAAILTFRLNPLDTFLPPLWTLVYQIKFYAAISLVLLLQFKFKSNKLIVFSLITLYTFLQFFFQDYGFMQNWGLSFYGNFFALGVLIAVLKFSYTTREKICSILLLLLTWLNLFTATDYTITSILVLIFTCVVLLFPLNFIFNKRSVSIIQKLDNITYPLYLIHFPFMLFALRKLSIIKSHQEIIYLVVFISTILICFYLNKYFNAPVSKYLMRLWNSHN